MKYFVFLIAIALSFPVFAQEKKTEKKAAAKKKPVEKKASSQEWGRFNSGGNKELDAKAKAKKK